MSLPDDPRLVPLYPLLYVGWADGVLTVEEARFIRERLRREPWLDDDRCRDFLDQWLDPDDPPDPAELQALHRAIQKSAGAVPDAERRSLAHLGVALAGARPGRDDDSVEGLLSAMTEAEQRLGVVGAEAVRDLLAAEEPSPEERAGEALAPLPAYQVPFDVEDLRAVLEGEEAETRDRVRSLLADPAFEHVYGLSVSQYRERVLEWIRILAREGLGAVGYPGDEGGAQDFRKAFVTFETLAHHDLSLVVKFGVQFGLFGGSILQLGTEKHHDAYLSRIGRAELLGCFAMTETGHGSNVRDIRTTATWDPDGDEFVVHTPDVRARKDYIGNAALHGRLATVFAQLRVGEDSHGVHAILVPIRDDEGAPLPGVSIEDCGEKEGLNGVDNGRLSFDRVRVPRENLLDRFGRVGEDGTYSSPISGASRRFFTMLGTLVAGRISIAAASVSVARSGLTIAVRYGDRRRQFGPAGSQEARILDYRSHQRLLMPLLARTYALHFAVQELFDTYGPEGEEAQRKLESRAAGLKAYASSHAVETLQACREACGGQGYLAVNRFGRLMADVDVFTTFEGANPVLYQLVARGLLTGFSEEFQEMRIWGVVRHFTDRAVAAVAERNPLTARRAGEEHLRDPAFQAAALQYREERLLRSAALRLRGRIDDGMDSFQAMNEVQDHLVSLARAHVERVVHEAFDRAIQHGVGSEDAAGMKGAIGNPGPVRSALETLRDLHALHRIEADRGWFLESGYIEARKARGIRDQVNELCAEARTLSRGLVDAFAIPDSVLGAPIGLE